jgi:hypothetical protein
MLVTRILKMELPTTAGGEEVRFWAHRPIDEDVEKIFRLVNAIHEVSADPPFEDERNELHRELAE